LLTLRLLKPTPAIAIVHTAPNAARRGSLGESLLLVADALVI